MPARFKPLCWLAVGVKGESQLLLKKRTVTIAFSLYFHCPLVYLSALYTVFSSSNSSRYFIEVIHSSIYIRSTEPCGHNAPLRSLRVGNRRGNTIDFIKARKKKKKKKDQRYMWSPRAFFPSHLLSVHMCFVCLIIWHNSHLHTSYISPYNYPNLRDAHFSTLPTPLILPRLALIDRFLLYYPILYILIVLSSVPLAWFPCADSCSRIPNSVLSPPPDRKSVV